MQMAKRLMSQLGLVGASFLLAGALQAFAFSEPTDAPPASDIVAPPINTGALSQDKRAPDGTAWLTADGIGSRYGAQIATLSGGLVVGTAKQAPGGTLDVDNSSHNATICLNGKCISDWSQLNSASK